MTRKPGQLLITGGAGFIGSNFIRYVFSLPAFKGRVINLDKLTYAGNPDNLSDIAEQYIDRRYFFHRVDICDFEQVKSIFDHYRIDAVVHFAAESHVDRSIFGPGDFIRTNILGTFNLLEAIRQSGVKVEKSVHFHQISTDEVYGSAEKDCFCESTPYQPNSPYSASKASADHLVRAYHQTYGLPVTLSNCSNNYGPFQFPEKLIPLMILNMLTGRPLPVYGDGRNIRDWIYVEDHCSAIWQILTRGKIGETYNIGGENEWQNITLVRYLCEIMAYLQAKEKKDYQRLITFVKDRPGHDRRYALNCDKLKQALGWQPSYDFQAGLKKTIHWYLAHPEWVRRVQTGEYRVWMKRNYGKR